MFIKKERVEFYEKRFEESKLQIEQYETKLKQKDEEIQKWKDTALQNAIKFATDTHSRLSNLIVSGGEICVNGNTLVNVIDSQAEKTDAQFKVMKLMEDNLFNSEKYKEKFKTVIKNNDDPLRIIKRYNELIDEEKIYLDGYKDAMADSVKEDV